MWIWYHTLHRIVVGTVRGSRYGVTSTTSYHHTLCRSGCVRHTVVWLELVWWYHTSVWYGGGGIVQISY
jgi:hypothetical protein